MAVNEVHATLRRIEKMVKKKCRACGVKPHQIIDAKLTCWNCGEVKDAKG